MSILVTGGAGFIGSNFILDWLDEHDEQIINLDKLTYASNRNNLSAVSAHPNYRFIHGDIADDTAVSALLNHYQPRAIINFAAESHVDRSIHEPEAFIQTNIVGTYRLLRCACNYWAALKAPAQKRFRFLHISTDEVYGSLFPDEAPFSESSRYEPNSPYSASKASSDHLVRAYHQTYGLPCITTNCSNNYGPYQFPEKLIPLVIHQALQGQALPIYGDGQQIRDWLYVKDHCRAIGQILSAGKLGEVYNISGGNEKTNLEVIALLCHHLDALQPRTDGKSYREQMTFVKDRPGHDRRYALNADKLSAALDWTPLETFESGIYKTVQWYLHHQSWVRMVITSSDFKEWTGQHYMHDGGSHEA